MRLVAFPHAGGSPMTYHHWSDPLSPEVELWHVTLPGRGARWCEPPADDWPTLVDELAGAVADAVQPPIALYGHSIGGLLAFEVARGLAARLTPPERLFVVGTPPPVQTSVPNLPDDDDQLVQLATRLGGVRPSVSALDDVVAQYLPRLRADLELAGRYRRLPGPPLTCPITVVACRDDRIAPPDAMGAWADETLVGIDLRFLPCGHFPGVAQEAALLDEIRSVAKA